MPGPACVFKEREYKLALNACFFPADESKMVWPGLKHILLQKQQVSIKILTWQKIGRKKKNFCAGCTSNSGKVVTWILDLIVPNKSNTLKPALQI